MPARKPVDQADVDSLDLYADNEEYLVNVHKMRLVARMCKWIEAGTYDPERAPKLWRPWYDAAAEIAKGYGERDRATLSAATRNEAAKQRAEQEHAAILNAEYLTNEQREAAILAHAPGTDPHKDIARATREAIEYGLRERPIREAWLARIRQEDDRLRREHPGRDISDTYAEACRIVGPMPPVPGNEKG